MPESSENVEPGLRLDQDEDKTQAAEPVEDDEVVLDFCVHCGVLLTDEIDQVVEPLCPNCGGDVEPEDFRCQGVFGRVDAERLIAIKD